MSSSYYSTNALLANTVTTNSAVTNSLTANALTVSGPISTPQLTVSNGLGITGALSATGNIQSGGALATGSGTAAAPGHTFVGNVSSGMFLPAANIIGISTSGTERVRVDAAGNVGVGTSAPNSMLHVAGTSTFGNTATLQQLTEVLNAKTGATGVVAHDYSTGAIYYHSSLAGNVTCNLTTVPTTDSRAIAVTLVLSQGATPYMCTAFQIDGVAQTLKWAGGSAPSGTASKVDVVTFSLIRTGAAWIVLGQNVNFG
jgi:hypothetical protein